MSGKNRINKDHYTQDGRVLRDKGGQLEQDEKEKLSRAQSDVASGAAAQRGQRKRKSRAAEAKPLVDTSILNKDDDDKEA